MTNQGRLCLAVTWAVLSAGTGLAQASPLVRPTRDAPLAIADLGNDNVAGSGFGAHCRSFNPEVSGHWGGEFGNGAVAAFPTDPDPAGYCTFDWHDNGWFARRIELRVLDGIGADGFDVYVKNPAGKWVHVYQYHDQTPGETWEVHEIYSFPAGKGQGSRVELKIVPMNVPWAGFATWGQLGVDYIAVYEDAKGTSRQPFGIAHTYLYAKDADWEIVESGGWATMQYTTSGEQFLFVLNAHRLLPRTGYTAVYYADPWGMPVRCLATATANAHGDLHLMQAVDTGDLPASNDANYPAGAKIWLVVSSDVDCMAQRMTTWRPALYLFESMLITFDDTSL
jgi:hypothetical protein